MTDQDILKFGEIQYLKGRLDELYKAIPTVTNMERRRKLDQRIEKYITKLKKVDEVAYRLYEVELNATHRVKVKGKLETENLFKEILTSNLITDNIFIFGYELGGIPKEFLELSNTYVQFESRKSINVVASFSILLSILYR